MLWCENLWQLLANCCVVLNLSTICNQGNGKLNSVNSSMCVNLTGRCYFRYVCLCKFDGLMLFKYHLCCVNLTGCVVLSTFGFWDMSLDRFNTFFFILKVTRVTYAIVCVCVCDSVNMLFSRISKKRFLVEYQRILRSPLCSFGFVLVLLLSVSLVQLFFVCCWALLKAIYFTSFYFFWFWNSSSVGNCVFMVSLWFILLGLLFCDGLFCWVLWSLVLFDSVWRPDPTRIILRGF